YHLSVASRQVASLRTIRKIIFGGEAFPKSSLRQLWELYRNHPVALINVYGPTECTCICSIYRISEEDFSEENMVQIAPIGVISDYFDYAIVDEHNRPVECGVVGELILGGGAVGKGYWGREDLSEKVFISNPSSPLLNDRYYKSGDLVRARRTGELEFVSRVDYQIKHMGHRIELPEIESVILAESAVVEACAIYKTGGNSGFIQLYYHGEVDEDFVITLLEKKLPTYMRPRVVVRVDELPKNRNGKVDRKQLGEE
ncbi:MAG: AMP-binding protein, partial [Gammaproteobacteria bacterium]|nr:AMP-binding protein [Gammaproteobacteria bacterium]